MLQNSYNSTAEDFSQWSITSPGSVLIILTMYLVFVLRLGPGLMASRMPFQLQRVLICYNSAVMLLNVFLTAWGGIQFLPYLYQQGCHPVNGIPQSLYLQHTTYVWYYFTSKIIELADTVFFILRKKYNQVTFLHVFHHAGIVFFTWFHHIYLPGLQATFVVFLNSGVHIFMYLYYMLAALGPSYRKYLWWKKYMTWMQMVQFVAIVTYMSGLLLWGCELPKNASVYFAGISLLFLVLFSDFYSRTYTSKVK